MTTLIVFKTPTLKGFEHYVQCRVRFDISICGPVTISQRGLLIRAKLPMVTESVFCPDRPEDPFLGFEPGKE